MTKKRIQSVSVAGCGYMGWVFGCQCAAKGYPVSLYDISPEAIDQAREHISQELVAREDQRLITPGEKQTILGRISFTQDLKKAVAKAVCIRDRSGEARTQAGDIRPPGPVFSRGNDSGDREFLVARLPHRGCDKTAGPGAEHAFLSSHLGDAHG